MLHIKSMRYYNINSGIGTLCQAPIARLRDGTVSNPQSPPELQPAAPFSNNNSNNNDNSNNSITSIIVITIIIVFIIIVVVKVTIIVEVGQVYLVRGVS